MILIAKLKAFHCGDLAGWLAAAALLVLAGCSAGERQSATEEAASPPAAPAQITPEDVEVFNVRLLRGRDGSGYHVEGQVQNNSPRITLTEFQFRMVMQDCLEGGVCEEIAEDTATIAVNLPPAQAAPFEAAPDFSAMPAPRGRLGWHYAVVATKGASQ
ncbi:MAG TPA: hypothetical protein VNN17_03430 [Terriglobia bacterium]|nr:hypothetical protein [Terriglobia bacterium]